MSTNGLHRRDCCVWGPQQSNKQSLGLQRLVREVHANLPGQWDAKALKAAGLPGARTGTLQTQLMCGTCTAHFLELEVTAKALSSIWKKMKEGYDGMEHDVSLVIRSGLWWLWFPRPLRLVDSAWCGNWQTSLACLSLPPLKQSTSIALAWDLFQRFPLDMQLRTISKLRADSATWYFNRRSLSTPISATGGFWTSHLLFLMLATGLFHALTLSCGIAVSWRTSCPPACPAPKHIS